MRHQPDLLAEPRASTAGRPSKLLVLILFLAVSSRAANIITTIAGTPWTYPAGPILALNAPLGQIHAVKVSPAGDIVADDSLAQNMVTISASGTLNVLAASLNSPSGLAFDNAGDIYFAETYNCLVRMVNAQGILSIVAGNGLCDYAVNGGPATSTAVYYPSDVARDGAGNLFILESAPESVVRMVNPAGIISTFAGVDINGPPGGTQAQQTPLQSPSRICLDQAGNLYVTQIQAATILKITPQGSVTTFAGVGVWGYSGDGGPALSAQINDPQGMSFDAFGNLYFADRSNNRVRMITPQGIISTVAGNGQLAYAGDGGPATAAALDSPNDVGVDSAGNLYISEANSARIRKVTPQGIISTFAGNGQFYYGGDGGPALNATFGSFAGIAPDNSGNIFLTANNRIRKIDSQGIISLYAGGNVPSGFQGDGGPAVGAQFFNPRGLAVDGSGNVFVADEVNNRIREVSPVGTISTSAGDGQELPDSGDGGPAASAVIPYPVAVMLDSQGSMYIAESSGAIRRINAQGIISTFATFAGVPGFIVITSATLDGWGDVYASDYLTRVWKADASGTISAVAGGASAGFSGDGGPAVNALLNFPLAIVVDNAGNRFIADQQNFRIRKISPDGTIFTIAGTGQSAYSGDGGPASAAALIDPQALAISGNNLLVGDGGIYLREISGTVNFNIFDPDTFVNQLYEDLLGRAADPSGLAFWSGQLNDGSRSRSQVAQQFFDSPEFHGNGLLVIKDYVAALGRDPDYAGWTWWVTQLESGAETSDQVLAAFLASAEFQTAYGNLDNTQFVMLVYQNVLQRQPDVNGLNYWTGQLDDGQTREWVMAQFIASPEFNNLIANRALANLLYLGFLRRSADPAGLQYWEQQLAGGQPQASVINGIIGSPEYLSRF